MKVISLVNEKGGVAKTALATHLAAALAILGKRVLMIDTDSQGHTSIAFGMEKTGGLYDLIVRQIAWKDVIKVVPPAQYFEGGIETSKGSLFLLPGDLQTRGIAENITDAYALHDRLQEVAPIFDYVILDTAPNPSKLQLMIFAATDYLLIPTRLEWFGFDGVARSMQNKKAFDQFRMSRGLLPTELAGIVPTMFKKKTLEHTENLKLLQEQFGAKVYTPIHDRVIWAESNHARKSLFSYQPKSMAAKDAWRFSEEFIGATNVVTA